MNYTHKYLQYNDTLLSILDEQDTKDNYALYVKHKVSKKDWQSHSTSMETWAQYAHDSKLHYPVTVFVEGDMPHCFISFSPQFIEVKFLDERMFWYVSMNYKRMLNNKIFLCETWIRRYMHEKDKPLHDLEKDWHLIFTEKGKLTVITTEVIREPAVKMLTEEKEAAHKVNVSQNWLDEPKFGEYAYLCDFKQILKEGDLLKDIQL